MANFLLSATNSSGKRETIRVEAETSQDAWRQLEQQGLHDITLHTSDVEALTRMTALDGGKVTPAEYLQLRGVSRVGFFWVLVVRMYLKARWMVVMSIALLALIALTSRPLGFAGILAIVMLTLPPVIALAATLLGKSFKYQRFVAAQAWGRWEDVLKLAPPFRSGATAFDAAAREACALAGLGRLDEGLKLVEERANATQTPRWMYLSRVAEIYDVAKLYDKALACHRLAYEDAPENSAVQLDLAMALLKNETDLPLAKELIATAELRHLSEIELMYMSRVKGMCALNSGGYAEAKRLFLAAHDKLQEFAASTPLIGVAINVNRANLAIALAKLHERRAAEEQFALARPRLVALDSTRLLERVQRALVTG